MIPVVAGMREFADDHGLSREGVDWLVNLDRDGFPHRERFSTVRERFRLPDRVEQLWSASAGVDLALTWRQDYDQDHCCPAANGLT
jgi:hypothetical protein